MAPTPHHGSQQGLGEARSPQTLIQGSPTGQGHTQGHVLPSFVKEKFRGPLKVTGLERKWWGFLMHMFTLVCVCSDGLLTTSGDLNSYT